MDTQQNPNEPSKPSSLDKADSKIAKERSVNVSGASVKNKVAVNRAAVNRAAVNRAAVNRADDKTGSLERKSGGR